MLVTIWPWLSERLRRRFVRWDSEMLIFGTVCAVRWTMLFSFQNLRTTFGVDKYDRSHSASHSILDHLVQGSQDNDLFVPYHFLEDDTSNWFGFGIYPRERNHRSLLLALSLFCLFFCFFVTTPEKQTIWKKQETRCLYRVWHLAR